MRMLAYLKPYILLIIFSVILSFLVVTFESLSLWFSGSLVNSIFKPESISSVVPKFNLHNINDLLKYWTYQLIHRDNVFDSLWFVCVFVIVFFLLKNAFSYVKSLLTGNLNYMVSRDLRDHLYSHTLVLPVTYYDRNRSGNIVSLIFNDIAAINGSLLGTFEKIISEPLRLIAYISILLIINARLTIIVFGIFPILGFVTDQIGKIVKRRSRRSLESIAGVSSILTETVQCIRAVKMFNMTEQEIIRFKTENQHFTKTNFRAQIFNALSSPLTETIGMFMVAGLLWYGGHDVLQGKGFTAEDFLRFLAFLLMMFQPLKSLSVVNNSIQTGMAAAERVFAIIDTPPEILNKVEQTDIPVFKEEIQFKSVSFIYPGCAEEVLHGVDFTVKKGEIVALVGSSGSGKSTILDLLPRFYDISSGAVLIDGKDIRSFELSGLRHLFGIVSQETILFNDSIRNNIAYGISHTTKEKIIEVAMAAQAWEFIEKMPLGLDTVIGEKGVMLSGGQRQRLSIARALLKNPDILILDEATSSLDTESERLVQSAINALMTNRTAIVVAHRLSTIAHADKILVLDNGRIVEQGTHKELISLGQRYKYFYDIQYATGEKTR